jgi:hypothetical protein
MLPFVLAFGGTLCIVLGLALRSRKVVRFISGWYFVAVGLLNLLVVSSILTWEQPRWLWIASLLGVLVGLFAGRWRAKRWPESPA